MTSPATDCGNCALGGGMTKGLGLDCRVAFALNLLCLSGMQV